MNGKIIPAQNNVYNAILFKNLIVNAQTWFLSMLSVLLWLRINKGNKTVR